MKKFLKGIKIGLGNFGSGIGTIVNSVLLLIVYVIGVGVTAILAKIFRKRFLETKRKEGSYWTELNLGKKELKEYYRQF